jgi:uncharacterized protein YegP (UPF0339 family)
LLVYRDVQAGWRWRLLAGNNRIVADSGESYKTKRGAMRAAERLRAMAMFAELDVK